MCFCCCCIFPFPCFDKINCDLFRSKLQVVHLLYICASVFLFIFMISTMSIISWSKLPSVNITFFIFLFLILVACMALSIIIVFLKSNEERQREMKEKITLLSKICLILTIISIILFLIEIIIISVSFSSAKNNYPSCIYDNETYSVSVQVYVGFFVIKSKNNNFTSNSTISDLVESKNESTIRILNSEKEEEFVCYEQFLTSAVYGMTYFTLEIINIASIFFFIELGKSDDPYKFQENQEQPNQNGNAPIINIQTQQVIIVNQAGNNNNSSELAHQTKGEQKLDKIDKSKFDKKDNENNPNQNKNSNYNINRNNQKNSKIEYPEKEDEINISQKHQLTSRVNQENIIGNQNRINININNQTNGSKDDNSIEFVSDRLKMK